MPSAANFLLRREPALIGIEDVLVWKAGPHSHNVFLQTWYELGAIGAFLFLLAGCGVIGLIARLPAAAQSFILAQFATFFAIAAFSWGVWQSWLMALTGLAPIYAALAGNFARAKVPLAQGAAMEFSPGMNVPLAADERQA